MSQIANLLHLSNNVINEKELLIQFQGRGGSWIFDIEEEVYRSYDFVDFFQVLSSQKNGRNIDVQKNRFLYQDGDFWFPGYRSESGSGVLIRWHRGRDTVSMLDMPDHLAIRPYVTKEGKIWLCYGDKLWYYDNNTVEWRHFSPPPALKGTVFQLIREIPYWPGRYFVFTNREVALFDLKTERFTSLDEWKDELTASRLTTSFFDAEQNFWFFSFTDESNPIDPFMISPQQTNFKKRLFPSADATAFIELNDQQYLIATQRGFKLFSEDRGQELSGPLNELSIFQNHGIYALTHSYGSKN